jgi:hypothetical protein
VSFRVIEDNISGIVVKIELNLKEQFLRLTVGGVVRGDDGLQERKTKEKNRQIR